MQGRYLDRFRYFESPFVACQWCYFLVDRHLDFLQPDCVLIPSPSLFPQLSPKPARLFNVFKHSRIISSTFSRIFISWLLILRVSLQHLTQIREHFSRDRIKLFLNYTTDLLFFFSYQTQVLTLRAPTFFLHVANQNLLQRWFCIFFVADSHFSFHFS